MPFEIEVKIHGYIRANVSLGAPARAIYVRLITLGRRQSKTLMLSTNVNQKSLKTEFLIAVCCLTGDKWQSKTLFLAILDPRSSIVKSVFDCRLPSLLMGVIMCLILL